MAVWKGPVPSGVAGQRRQAEGGLMVCLVLESGVCDEVVVLLRETLGLSVVSNCLRSDPTSDNPRSTRL